MLKAPFMFKMAIRHTNESAHALCKKGKERKYVYRRKNFPFKKNLLQNWKQD